MVLFDASNVVADAQTALSEPSDQVQCLLTDISWPPAVFQAGFDAGQRCGSGSGKGDPTFFCFFGGVCRFLLHWRMTV